MNPTDWLDRLEIDRSPAQVRKFGLILALLMGAFFGIRSWIAGEILVYGLLAGAAVGVLALAFPRSLIVVFVPWMVAARMVGLVITHLLLSVIFYLIFTPVGWVMRLAGRDPLRLKRGGESYWIKRDPDRKTDYERMF
ncbi:MAG: SxtJ family membrane protein [Fidelibacterota bacterium]